MSTGRDAQSSGTVTWKLYHLDSASYKSFTISSVTAASHSVTVTAGRATANITIPTGSPTGRYQIEASNFTGRTVASAVSGVFQIGALASKGFVLASVPTVVQVSDNLGSVTATAKNEALATITTFTGAVTVEAYTSGTVDTTALIGTKTVNAVAGVATFSTLTFAKPGVYQLQFSATGFDTVTSNPITVMGDFSADDIVGLRQNIRDDGTVWKKTTNISSPTLSDPTSAEKSIIDADMASTSNTVNHGYRFFMPYNMKLQRVDFKVKVSTLTGTPTIRLYTSQDATSVSTGTWVQQAEFTPVHTNVFMSAFSFSVPVLCRGVWITINQGGGSATATWYAVHVSGPYLSPAISFVEQTSSEVLGTETTLSIPTPAKKLAGAQTVTRNFIIRNNTSATYELEPVVAPARNGGDTLADTDNVVILDERGEAVAIVVLDPYESRQITVQYTITAADNDNSGKHYVRFTPYERSESTGSILHITGNAANHGFDKRDLSTFTISTSQGTGGYDYTDVWVSPSLGPTGYGAVANDGVSNVNVTPVTGTLASQQMSSVASPANWNRVVVIGNKAYVFSATSTTVKQLTLTSSFVSTAFGSVPTAFTLPTQTSGAKNAAYKDTTRMWVCNGETSNIKIYDIDTLGTVYTTIDTSVNLSGLTIRAIGWDGANRELYVVTAVSAGSRTIARYAENGTFIASVTNSDRNTLEGNGIGIMAGKVYVLYGGRYVWRYNAGALTGGTELSDRGVHNGTGKALVMGL